MSRRTVHVEGLKELDAALGQLAKEFSPRYAKTAMTRTLMKAGKPIQERAQALAPARDPGAPVKTYRRGGVEAVRRPGTLKALVQISTRLTRRQARAARRAGKDTAEVYIGTRDRIASLEEFGTARSKAQPFLRPAWENGKMRALQTIAAELGAEIKAAAARAAKRTRRAKR